MFSNIVLKPRTKCPACLGCGWRDEGRVRRECDACHGLCNAEVCADCNGIITLEAKLVSMYSRRLHTLLDCPWTEELKSSGEWQSPKWELAVLAEIERFRAKKILVSDK